MSSDFNPDGSLTEEAQAEYNENVRKQQSKKRYSKATTRSNSPRGFNFYGDDDI